MQTKIKLLNSVDIKDYVGKGCVVRTKQQNCENLRLHDKILSKGLHLTQTLLYELVMRLLLNSKDFKIIHQ